MNNKAFKNRNFFLWSALSISFIVAPFSSFIYILVRIIISIIPTLMIKGNAFFLDSAIDFLKNKVSVNHVIISIIVVISLLILTEIMDVIAAAVNVRLKIKVNEKLSLEILNKKEVLQYKYIENNEYLDLISRIDKESVNRIVSGFMNIMSIIDLIIRAVGISIILISDAWWTIILLILFSGPLVAMAQKSGKANYLADQLVSRKQREVDNLGNILTSRSTVDERYLFQYTPFINDKWNFSYKSACAIQIRTEKKWFVKMKATGVVVTVASIFLVGSIVPAVYSGKMSVGIFISLINGILGIMKTTTWDLTSTIDELTQFTEFMKDFTSFFSLEEITTEKKFIDLQKPFEFKSLTFENVCFAYPGTTNNVLNHLSFEIKAGKHYSFVGVNGSGKTTIIKLLIGLYENYKGRILVNKIDIKKISPCDRRKIFAIAFQDFAKYYVSIKDNILLGGEDVVGSDRLDYILNHVNLDDAINKLPNGIDTILGKIDKNSVDMSGGEWQKIAIARCLASFSPLRIFDEPTAALDPVSESEMYKQFKIISKNRTTILISHRLGSTKLADCIYVLSEGKIVEKGSHYDLLNQNSLYKEMFESQRSWYSE